ncbi:hypothetical protein LJK87_15980 [Paenibacillus sp. P25]|nr:hypothetical protein LJK87_15980 [Paenibacillus sp. P25]
MKKRVRSILLFGTLLLSTTSVAGATPYYIYQSYNSNHAHLNFKFDPSIDNLGYHDIAGTGSYAYDSSDKVEAYYTPNANSPQWDYHLKWYGVNNTSVSWYGATFHYNPPGSYIGSGDYENKASIPIYKYSTYDEVQLNKFMMDKLDDVSKRYETASHEMGHVLGLHHDDYNKTTNPTIMMQYDWLGSNTPTWWDFAKINTLYQ